MASPIEYRTLGGIGAALLLLAGCSVSPTTALRHPDGRVAQCTATGGGIGPIASAISMSRAVDTHDRCVAGYQEQGFERVERDAAQTRRAQAAPAPAEALPMNVAAAAQERAAP